LDNIGQEGYELARRIRDQNLESREARSKLKVSGKPYWRSIGLGLHLGYRKGERGGKWCVRRYLGEQNYQVETIAIADDLIDADGLGILNFWQAQEKARELRDPRARAGEAYTVARAVADYLAWLEGSSSYRDARSRLYAHVLPAFADTPVAELTADDMRRWHRNLAKQRARKRTGQGKPQNYRETAGEEGERKRRVTANGILRHFKAVLNHVWEEGKVRCEKVWNRVDAFKGVTVPRSRYLNLAECKRLINASDAEFRPLVQAALETGARYSELARLRVADLNHDAKTLHVLRSKTSKDRHIILTDEGYAFFASLAAGRPGSALMLGKEWKASFQNRPMLRACSRAKIDPPAPFHSLRHTYASLSIMGGVPMMVVARNLGHTDTRMVDRTYGHLAPDFIADAIRKGAPRFGVRATNVRRLS
jgi:integrase